MLRLHSARPPNARSDSLMSVLSNGGTTTYKKMLRKSGLGGDSSDDEDEGQPLLGDARDGVAATGGDDEDEHDRRGSRSRSKSQRRALKWYRRPSPMWSVPDVRCADYEGRVG